MGADVRPNHLRIVVHDYGGYPFIVQLSRALSNRGHEVLHLFADGFRHPKGQMDLHPADPPTLSIDPVRLSEAIRRNGFQRVSQERRYARLLAEHIKAFRPDLVISANSPLDVQATTSAMARQTGAAFVFWLQDIHSVAISRILGRRLRVLGMLIGARFARLEQRLLREADAIVAISADYLPIVHSWGIPVDKVEVIENWAPLDDDPGEVRSDAWAARNGIHGRPVVMYAGTLALKHNPGLLLELARGLPQAVVVVAAEGPGADWLRTAGGEVGNLHVIPLQPYSSLAEMLGSADLLVVVLEPDASTFSVPSKVLTYLAAGRAILAAVPETNAAAKVIVRAHAGVVVNPHHSASLVAAARQLLEDPENLRAAGAAGRAYARATFDIERITDRFEATFYETVNRKSDSLPPVAVDTGPAVDTSHEASS
jgi:glycosyltransferase involved in cell wall biosynthesis